MANQPVIQLVKELRKASTKNKAPIWSKIAEFATKPTSVRKTINVNEINHLTKDNAIVVFPGKVLGTGIISHKITISSLGISNSAATKIIEAGGKVITFDEMMAKNPTGKGVVMLG